MALNLEVQMDTNRTKGSPYPGRVRQSDDWVKTTLRRQRGKKVTARLDKHKRWEVEVDAADGGTLILQGSTGTNELNVSFRPKVGATAISA